MCGSCIIVFIDSKLESGESFIDFGFGYDFPYIMNIISNEVIYVVISNNRIRDGVHFDIHP